MDIWSSVECTFVGGYPIQGYLSDPDGVEDIRVEIALIVDLCCHGG